MKERKVSKRDKNKCLENLRRDSMKTHFFVSLRWTLLSALKQKKLTNPFDWWLTWLTTDLSRQNNIRFFFFFFKNKPWLCEHNEWLWLVEIKKKTSLEWATAVLRHERSYKID